MNSTSSILKYATNLDSESNRVFALVNGSYVLKECETKDLYYIGEQVIFYYLQFCVWLPLVFIGIVGHSVLFYALSEKYVIYVQAHYLILAKSYCVNSIFHLIFVMPVIFTLKMTSSHLFVIYANSAFLMSNLFLYIETMIICLFGYQKIVSHYRVFGGRYFIYKKHTVDLIAFILFISLSMVCFEIREIVYIFECSYESSFYGFILFKEKLSIVALVVDIIFLNVVPLVMIALNIVAISTNWCKDKSNINGGLGNLPTKNVYIIRDEMRDNTNFVLYIMMLVLIMPLTIFRYYPQFKTNDGLFNYILKLHFYLQLSFSALSFIPFFIFQKPLRVAIEWNIRRHFKKDPTINTTINGVTLVVNRNDTLLSIGSIEKSDIFIRSNTVDEAESDSVAETDANAKKVKFLPKPAYEIS